MVYGFMVYGFMSYGLCFTPIYADVVLMSMLYADFALRLYGHAFMDG